jgi:6-pyruvoyltetrahydropterin/6-carboxytetrahydropterin synthase
MYSITKEVHFCYGHRLLHHQGRCRHLHGHNGRAVIRLERAILDGLGMVCDFTDLGRFVKDWLEREIDHNLLLHRDDPLLHLLQGAGERCYMMDCNPTAENIARLIFETVAQAGFPVVEVTLYETASACASYRSDGHPLRNGG